MSDKGEVLEIAIEDELREKLCLVLRRIALVEGLVGLAEALEVDGDDLVIAGEVRRHVAPREGVGAEPVDQEHRRTFAAFRRVEPHRRIRRSEPGEGFLAGGERRHSEPKQHRRERESGEHECVQPRRRHQSPLPPCRFVVGEPGSRPRAFSRLRALPHPGKATPSFASFVQCFASSQQMKGARRSCGAASVAPSRLCPQQYGLR